MARALAQPATVLQAYGEEDIRPLYFIPWMPGIEDSQSRELHQDGLRELTARLLTQAMAAVGQSPVLERWSWSPNGSLVTRPTGSSLVGEIMIETR